MVTRKPSSAVEPTLLEVALDALEAGISVFPVKEDGSKAPDVGKENLYLKRRSTEQEIRSWFVSSHRGMAAATGQVSGGLELLEFEGRAEDLLTPFREACRAAGIEPLLNRILRGYSQRSPSGGVHMFYRCPNPKGRKLARRRATEQERSKNPADRIKTLVETKGQGGYAVIAPSNGSVHASGRPWTRVCGQWSQVAEITEKEHAALLNVARSFDEMPRKDDSIPTEDVGSGRPGDVFNEKGTWEEVGLEEAGWVMTYERSDGTQYWRRPGKDVGWSATLNNGGHDQFHVFSSSTIFEQDKSYKKFSVFAHLWHRGEDGVVDWSSAASATRKMGYNNKEEAMPQLLFFKDVEAKPVRWFWRPYLPWAKIVIIDGEGEMGKSSIVTDLGATGTVGGRLPDGSSAPEIAVLLLGAEDDVEDTMKPRFEAAGADMGRVASLILPKDEKGNTKPLTIPDQIGWLRHSILSLQSATKLDGVMVVIDPISSYLSINVHSHNDASVRTAMLPLHDLMMETGALCVLIRHFTKDEKQSARNRGGGSVGFINAARSALIVGRHPHKPELSVLARNKNNLASKEETPSWGYRLEKHPVLDVVRVVWEGIQAVDANEIVATPDARKNSPQKDKAMKIIAELLERSDGRIHSKEALKACSAAGISRATVYSAKKSMGLMEEPFFKPDGGYDRWEWFWPMSHDGTVVKFGP